MWDAYAIKVTIEENQKLAREKALEEGREEGREEGKSEVVRNLLSSNRSSIAEIANFSNVTEAFVSKIIKEMKK